MKKTGNQSVGEIYTSTKNFPYISPEDLYNCGHDVKVGEQIKVVAYNRFTKEYVMLNLSLGISDAWFMVKEADFISIVN